MYLQHEQVAIMWATRVYGSVLKSLETVCHRVRSASTGEVYKGHIEASLELTSCLDLKINREHKDLEEDGICGH